MRVIVHFFYNQSYTSQFNHLTDKYTISDSNDSKAESDMETESESARNYPRLSRWTCSVYVVKVNGDSLAKEGSQDDLGKVVKVGDYEDGHRDGRDGQ